MNHWSERYRYNGSDPRMRLGGWNSDSILIKYKRYRQVEKFLFASNIILGGLLFLNYDHMKKMKVQNQEVQNIWRSYLGFSINSKTQKEANK